MQQFLVNTFAKYWPAQLGEKRVLVLANIYLLSLTVDATHRSLETDIRKETRGPYGQLLEELFKCERYEESPEELMSAGVAEDLYTVVDRNLVNKDVEDLHLALNE